MHNADTSLLGMNGGSYLKGFFFNIIKKMENSIKIFEKEEFGSIRVTEMNGEPMFCLSDVAKALEYARPADAVTSHCKGVVILPTPTSGGVQPIKYGKESEVYRLIMKSNAKKAEAFQDWVCSDVLPSIRKTGTYSLPQDYISALEALVASEKEKQRLAIENKVMQPKAEYFDALVDRQLLTNFRDTAKEFRMGQKEFVAWLLERKFIYRDKKKQLRPYSDYVATLFELKEYKSGNNLTHTGVQTLITPKGRATFKLLLNK